MVVTALLAAGPAAAQTLPAAGDRQCWRADFGDEAPDARITSIDLTIEAPADGGDVEFTLSLGMTEPYPAIAATYGVCEALADGTPECRLDCDGGRFKLPTGDDGTSLQVAPSGLVMAPCRDPARDEHTLFWLKPRTVAFPLEPTPAAACEPQ